MRRYPVQMQQLVHTDPQSDADLRIQLPRTCMLIDEPVELRLTPEAAEDNLGSQSGIPRIQRRRITQQQIRSVPAVMDTLQHTPCTKPCRRHD